MFLSWNPDDQDKAVFWQALQRLRCQDCGCFPDEHGRDDMEAIEHFCVNAEKRDRLEQRLHAEGHRPGLRAVLVPASEVEMEAIA